MARGVPGSGPKKKVAAKRPYTRRKKDDPVLEKPAEVIIKSTVTLEEFYKQTAELAAKNAGNRGVMLDDLKTFAAEVGEALDQLTMKASALGVMIELEKRPRVKGSHTRDIAGLGGPLLPEGSQTVIRLVQYHN